MEVVAVTPGVGLGCLAKPPIAQDEPGTLQLRFDPDPLDVAFEADGVAFQIMFDLEHPADLHEQFVVREPVAHLVGGGAMGVCAENPPQPPQVGGKLLDRDTLLVTQFTYRAPMRSCRRSPHSPPLDSPIPSPGEQIVEEDAQNRDKHHDGDGNTTKYHLVQVHRHEITLSRAPRLHKLRPERETSRYLFGSLGRRSDDQPKPPHELGSAAVAIDRNVHVIHVVGSR